MGRVGFIKLMYLIVYFGFLLAVFAAMWLLREWEFFMRMFADGVTCVSLTSEFDCISASVLYRISLSMFLFSLFMAAVLTCCGLRCATVLNEGLFFTKFTILALAFLLTLQLSNELI